LTGVLVIIVPRRSTHVHLAGLGGSASRGTGRGADRTAGNDPDRASDDTHRRTGGGTGSRATLGSLRFLRTAGGKKARGHNSGDSQALAHRSFLSE
jgi:hypothetical protein